MASNHQLKVINHANDTKKKGHLRLSGLLAGATAVLVTVSAGVSHAQSGTPDPTFGTNGRVLTTFGGSGVDEATAVAVQPDGKIVAAGSTTAPNGDLNFALVRYNPNGTIDTTFGGPGVVTNFRTDVPTGDPSNPSKNSADQALAVAIQPDGKIVVGGQSDAPNGDLNFALVRYNPDSSVDTTFGDNSIFPGTVLTNFEDLGSDITDKSTDILRAIAIQADGKIVAAGYSTAPMRPSKDGNFALVRYNPNGTIDTTFGDNSNFPGTVLTDFGNESFDGASAVAIQADGKIVAAGTTDRAGSQDFALVRYSTNGVPNTGFGRCTGDINGGIDNRVCTNFRRLPDGKKSRDLAYAIAIQADGKIVVAGKSNAPNGDFNFAVARYFSAGTAPDGTNLAGRLDPSFGGSTLNPGRSLSNFDSRSSPDPTTTTGPTENSHDEAHAVAIQADGKIVAAGWSDAPLGVNNTNFALVRYDINGVSITGFGTNNRVLTDIENTTDVNKTSTDRANAVTIQADGKIVAAGGSDSPVANANFNFALVRYLP